MRNRIRAEVRAAIYGALGLSAALSHVQAQELEEITVTATRQSENINRVPLSITAFTGDQLDQQHVQNVDDLSSITPGLQFHHTAGGGNANVTLISIRGIQSNIGDGTTGIYIDDTPVQVRKAGLSFTSTNAYPQLFDIDRVEVLRGPQGTLFGSGSMGGAVRFITATPDLHKFSLYTRDELSYTQHGDPNSELSLAVGGPIVDGVLGFRFSARFRRDGGFIDQESRADLVDAQSRSAEGASGVNTAFRANNVNWQNSSTVRLALTYAPTDTLKITPSVFYQNIHANSSGTFWDYFSNPSQGQFVNADGVGSPYLDRWTLAALNVSYDFGPMSLISNTSYLDRNNTTYYDGTTAVLQLTPLGPQNLTPQQFLPNLPRFAMQIHDLNQQLNWTQELRLQSSQPLHGLSWVVGGFFQQQKSTNQDFVPLDANTFTAVSQALGALQDPPQSYESYSDLFYGATLINNLNTYQTLDLVKVRQTAAFADLTYEVVNGLKLTAGVRYTRHRIDATSLQGGPFAGTSELDGFTQSHAESSTTPKGSITWQLTDANMIYGTVAKGFRSGGVNQPLPSACAPALQSIGLQNAPDSYNSDNLVSYEIGTKNRLFNNSVNITASIFYIKWKDIQQSIYLSQGCNRSVTLNANAASSRGFDLQGTWAAASDLILDGSVSYTKAVYDNSLEGTPDAVTGVAPLLIAKGNDLTGVVPWTAVFGGTYTMNLWGHEETARLDYSFSSRQSRAEPVQDPRTTQFLPYAVFIPQVSQLNARYAVKFGPSEVSLFVENLTDSHPSIQAVAGDQFNSVTQSYTIRPRTFGVGFSVRL